MAGTLHLAQALSNRGRRGRKRDFVDAERLVKRLVAQELTLSFVPDAEQRLWRTVMRRKYQLTRNRVQVHNRLEALLEEAHLKLSSLVSDLLGASARRMLQALADRDTDPAALAALADQRLRATPEQLRDALGAATALNPVYRRLIGMALEDVRLIEEQIRQLDQEMAGLIRPHQEAVQRLAEVPGLGVDSAQQIIAEVGATAATFPSPKQLASWVGTCPGAEESAGVNASHRSPSGNRQMRRLLHQAANAAVKTKGSIFLLVYRRLVPRLGHAQAIGAIAQVGATAATFPSPKQLASWVGTCPGAEESAGVNASHRSPSGNRQMRRLLHQAANAAVKTKGSIFLLVYRRLVPRLGHAQAIGAIAHRLCRLIWKILHQAVRYEERGPAVSRLRTQRRALKMARELRRLGYRVELIPTPLGTPA